MTKITWETTSNNNDLVEHIKSTMDRIKEYCNQDMVYTDAVLIVANGKKFTDAKEKGLSDWDAALEAGILEYRPPHLIPKITHHTG